MNFAPILCFHRHSRFVLRFLAPPAPRLPISVVVIGGVILRAPSSVKFSRLRYPFAKIWSSDWTRKFVISDDSVYGQIGLALPNGNNLFFSSQLWRPTFDWSEDYLVKVGIRET